jgi:hypothetical protein
MEVPLEVVPGRAYYPRIGKMGWAGAYKPRADLVPETEALAELQKLKLQK